ncbi:hypothetical protein BDA96_08G145200 [Sorghum bicolor]|uniref:Uncharacterized protein n=1 Tax=Sorghum bicolor TaxID=4558 RepID=A0A921U749_SORBI|nr:hypothetical protein BDA96_08G145200 [Sorghum bicolor]
MVRQPTGRFRRASGGLDQRDDDRPLLSRWAAQEIAGFHAVPVVRAQIVVTSQAVAQLLGESEIWLIEALYLLSC